MPAYMDSMGGVRACFECRLALVSLEPFWIPSDIVLGWALPLTTESDDLQAHLAPPPFYMNLLPFLLLCGPYQLWEDQTSIPGHLWLNVQGLWQVHDLIIFNGYCCCYTGTRRLNFHQIWVLSFILLTVINTSFTLCAVIFNHLILWGTTHRGLFIGTPCFMVLALLAQFGDRGWYSQRGRVFGFLGHRNAW